MTNVVLFLRRATFDTGATNAMATQMQNQTSITLRIGSASQSSDLCLSDVASLPDLADELAALLDATQPSNAVRIELLPPIAPSLSVRSAFNVIVDTWSAADPEQRPTLDCIVASEAVVDTLAPLLPDRRGNETNFQIGFMRVAVTAGDITAAEADAIVNASSIKLWLGGGVSHAIRQACGPGLQAEMSAIASRGALGNGDGVVTGSHGLRTARHIIHVASAAGDDDTVTNSIRSVLRLSVERKFASVAMPALGTGTGGMAMGRFAEHLVDALRDHADHGAGFPKVLRVVLYRQSDAGIVVEVLRRNFA